MEITASMRAIQPNGVSNDDMGSSPHVQQREMSIKRVKPCSNPILCTDPLSHPSCSLEGLGAQEEAKRVGEVLSGELRMVNSVQEPDQYEEEYQCALIDIRVRTGPGSRDHLPPKRLIT
jgi:hypothetical protein